VPVSDEVGVELELLSVCRFIGVAGVVGVAGGGGSVGLVLVTGGRPPGRPHSSTLTTVVVDGHAVLVMSSVTVAS
jgi:hypothetical protein